jgi:hypothetical protein
MEKFTAYRVTVSPEFKGVFNSDTLLIHATSFIFEYESSPVPMVSFQVAVRDEENDDYDYETVVAMPMKAVAMVERVYIEIEAEVYYAVSVECQLVRNLPRFGG